MSNPIPYDNDHLIPFYSDDTNKNIFECFILLSGLAAITKRVKIGQIVTCNSYRNPPLVAKMLSTLDIISNARVELGIGAGWYEQEYVAYGYQFPANVSRIKQLDESLSIIKAMWKDKCASFEGKYYRIKEAICNPKPIQKPHPIIMVGGSGERYLLKVVAKHADRYNLFVCLPRKLLKLYHEAHASDVICCCNQQLVHFFGVYFLTRYGQCPAWSILPGLAGFVKTNDSLVKCLFAKQRM